MGRFVLVFLVTAVLSGCYSLLNGGRSYGFASDLKAGGKLPAATCLAHFEAMLVKYPEIYTNPSSGDYYWSGRKRCHRARGENEEARFAQIQSNDASAREDRQEAENKRFENRFNAQMSQMQVQIATAAAVNSKSPYRTDQNFKLAEQHREDAEVYQGKAKEAEAEIRRLDSVKKMQNFKIASQPSGTMSETIEKCIITENRCASRERKLDAEECGTTIIHNVCSFPIIVYPKCDGCEKDYKYGRSVKSQGMEWIKKHEGLYFMVCPSKTSLINDECRWD